MNQLLKIASLLTGADHYMFGFEDEQTIGSSELLPDEGSWIGWGDHGLMISVITELPEKEVRLEYWDGPPPNPDGHEVTETSTVALPTGSISHSMLAGGIEHDIFQIPQGRYLVRVSAWDRQATADEYRQAGERSDFDRTDPDFVAAYQRLTGKERYLIQFWPET
ncbi:hypothetical protein BZB76_6553 [Actinomadura pelletieri DSM 43383]|uniref:Uncharacterized protein n=1 Tax=Actinomadura pelletieri DSM 43383 TaxID=1120940 RepID=A0A495QA01_9ACTN|nr:hypothetical protein [Actinomadura pelletieri]RKS68292.1 hypothetical protein BZB76_6553 [Actinomadura pelletieri DSM 43383]